MVTSTPYSFASAPLNSDTPATIAATGSVTSEDERRPLPDGAGERQQQIVGALRTGI